MQALLCHLCCHFRPLFQKISHYIGHPLDELSLIYSFIFCFNFFLLSIGFWHVKWGVYKIEAADFMYSVNPGFFDAIMEHCQNMSQYSFELIVELISTSNHHMCTSCLHVSFILFNHLFLLQFLYVVQQRKTHMMYVYLELA